MMREARSAESRAIPNGHVLNGLDGAKIDLPPGLFEFGGMEPPLAILDTVTSPGSIFGRGGLLVPDQQCDLFRLYPIGFQPLLPGRGTSPKPPIEHSRSDNDIARTITNAGLCGVLSRSE